MRLGRKKNEGKKINNVRVVAVFFWFNLSKKKGQKFVRRGVREKKSYYSIIHVKGVSN